MRSGTNSFFLHGSTPIFAPRYYGAYSPHSPSNAPVSAKNSARQKQVATFKEFHAYYEKVFGEPLPDHWYDERNVCLHSRVLDARIGKLLLKEEGGKVELVDGAGEVVFAVNSLAAQAISFIADTGAFYVRELPGDLDDDEKVALVATLVEHKDASLGVLSEPTLLRADPNVT